MFPILALQSTECSWSSSPFTRRTSWPLWTPRSHTWLSPFFQAHKFFLHFTMDFLHFRFVALPCLTSVHRVFTKVLALLHPHGILFVGYLDNLLSKQLQQILSDNVALTFQLLQQFSWILNLQKSVLGSNHHLGVSGSSPRHSSSQNIFLSVEI